MKKNTTEAEAISRQNEKLFMLYVKHYLEYNHPMLMSTKQDCSSAFLSFTNKTYGTVSVMFYRDVGHIFNYYASSSSDNNFVLIPASNYESASGRFKVLYRHKDGSLEYYHINVGKVVQ